MMIKDKLFLLKPDFMDGDNGPYYCQDTLPVEGLLSYYPHLRQNLEIQYVDFPRPRPLIVEEIGLDNQGAPVLVLADREKASGIEAEVKEYNGRWFISDSKDIRVYLAAAYGTGIPHP